MGLKRLFLISLLAALVCPAGLPASALWRHSEAVSAPGTLPTQSSQQTVIVVLHQPPFKQNVAPISGPQPAGSCLLSGQDFGVLQNTVGALLLSRPANCFNLALARSSLNRAYSIAVVNNPADISRIVVSHLPDQFFQSVNPGWPTPISDRSAPLPAAVAGILMATLLTLTLLVWSAKQLAAKRLVLAPSLAQLQVYRC